LGVEKEDIVAALSSKGRLVRCGLLSVEPGSTHSLLRRIDLLSESFSDRLMSPVSSPEDFLLGAVKPGKLPTLGVGDYRHIQRQYSLTEQYLRNVLDHKKPGVNILVHGDPGTGKSELVRLLAKQLDAGLLEVASEDEQGDSFVGKTRLRAYKAAQQFFASRRTLILFDEIQDVFDDGGFFGRSTAQLRKAEINTLLEENPLPTFWLSNDIGSMDNAFIRRFDIVVELDVPPLGRRKEILHDALADLPVPAATVQRFARHAHLSPAVVNRAASVVRMVSGGMQTQEVPVALESLFNQTLMAQGYAQIEKTAANALPTFYDTRFVNADVDLARLMEGVRTNPSARICLYGPPGTGKSAFAQWLAEQLQRPFHNRKLSDILSMYVGGTEKNLKRAFFDAEQDNAVLLLDEVDSFLQDRRQAQRSWEVTQVNEMLVQMEAFNGVFIASTNLMDNLDQAALRRFDLKIRLDYLMPEQAWSLFLAQCQSMQFSVATEELQSKVHALRLLTPGDFAAVQRRHRFHPVKDAHALVDSLREECAVKEGGNSRRIGFV
jgi:SpoVK/Ycf46/Vps4 family AAA+-type ATPase